MYIIIIRTSATYIFLIAHNLTTRASSRIHFEIYVLVMNRLLFSVGRSLPKYLCRIPSGSSHPHPINAFVGLEIREYSNSTKAKASAKANTLKKVIPEFWILKMKTAYVWLDVNGDGYITAEDFSIWIKEMARLFPDMNEEQKKILEAKHARVWGDLLDGEGKGPDYKVTENMFIEKFFHVMSKEGAEAMMRQEWNNNFTVMDVNQDGVISKEEHRCFFEARKQVDPNGAIVAFSAIDKDRDGVITREEYVEAAMEYFFNFSDETKPSKHFFGPLVKI